MGATGWSYTTPYRPNIEEALQELRRSVFESGDYRKPRSNWEIGQSLRERFLATPEDERADWERLFLVNFEKYGPKAPDEPRSPPESMAELLERCGANGTHSILDIARVGKRPGFGVAAPVPKKVLAESFGSTEPTREQLEPLPEPLDQYFERLGRWQAAYLIIYKDGRPHEILFEGNSGD